MSSTTSTLTAQTVRVDDLPNRPRGFLRDEHLVSVERWLDAKFTLPGTSIRFGLDGMIGLIPGIGDLATTGMSVVFIADAWKMGARKRVLARMTGNVAIDMFVGAIPLVGDLFDFAFRSNTKNLALLKREREHLLTQKIAPYSSETV
ncbi:DUF4112 domain-containing protein [Pseudahrensia aquimaris]|uniref:DUF4112 domain-containing protein n=1 Tax=Pseudahrensia aquimaris TaxID=744461 RepID=A0ABW3FFI7_9HYPH